MAFHNIWCIEIGLLVWGTTPHRNLRNCETQTHISPSPTILVSSLPIKSILPEARNSWGFFFFFFFLVVLVESDLVDLLLVGWIWFLSKIGLVVFGMAEEKFIVIVQGKPPLLHDDMPKSISSKK